MPDGAIALFHISTKGVKNIGFGFNPSDDWDVLKEWNDAAVIKLQAWLACKSDGYNYSSSFPTKVSSGGRGKPVHSKENIAYLWNIRDLMLTVQVFPPTFASQTLFSVWIPTGLYHVLSNNTLKTLIVLPVTIQLSTVCSFLLPSFLPSFLQLLPFSCRCLTII